MFDIDNWMEIFATIRKNKLRTFLTGFSVAWGIFMLIVLLASGKGVQNGVMLNFGDRAINSFEMWGDQTSLPYKGISSNRRIKLDRRDLDFLSMQKGRVQNIAPSIHIDTTATYKTEMSLCTFSGVTPAYAKVNGIKIVGEGRFINDMDIHGLKKIAVINQRLKEVLFNKENPLGKYITAGSINFKVVGIYKEREWGNQGKAYIPFSTSQLLYHQGWGFDNISFTAKGLNTVAANDTFQTELKKGLAQIHHYNPEDTKAIGMWSTMDDYLQTMGIFNGINLFIWIIGIGTLIAGIVGVSNIMLITVKERTKELGIRKALGANPTSILKLIMLESVTITSFFGYIGMFAGIGLSETVNYFMNRSAEAASSGDSQMSIFYNPTVNISIALGASLLMIASGVIAGYFPARKAVAVTAVEAMRSE